jgi:hypothetical protein
MAQKKEEKSSFNKEDFFTGIWALGGRNAFPSQLREEYIDRLRENNEGSKKLLRKGELKLAEASEVYNKIAVYDPELVIFKTFVERFYTLSPKASRFLKSPDFSDADKKRMQDLKNQNFALIDESLNKDNNWIIQEVTQFSGMKTNIVVSRRSARIVKGTMKRKDLKEETWRNLETDVKSHFNDKIESLQEVAVTVTAPYRFHVGIEIDWKEGVTELSSDIAEWNEDEGKPEDRQKVRTEALSFLAEKLDLDNKSSFSAIDVSGEIKDPELRKKLEKQNNAGYLIVMRGGSYHLKGTETENEEDVRARLRLFDIYKITEAAKSYYAGKGTFANFLKKYKQFDRTFTRIQGGALGSEDPVDCSGLFLKIFDSSTKETPEKYVGTYLEHRDVEALSFEYLNSSGEWIIRTPNYSRRIRDAFISELNKLSQKPSRHPKPKVGKAP